MKSILLALLFTSCTHLPVSNALVSHNGKKQKQRIAAIEKKIGQIEEDLSQKGKEIEILRKEKKKAELEFIKDKVEQHEEELRSFREGRGKVRKEISFAEEREVLHQLIQDGPSPTSYEARLLLDQLLRIITSWSSEAV